jgi:hypothetical protein
VDPIVLGDGDRASVVKALASAWSGTSSAYEAIAGARFRRPQVLVMAYATFRWGL